MVRGTATPQLAAPAQKGPLDFSAWVEVDLSALEHNLRSAQRRTRAQVVPILKGDAYGHGAPVVAAFLQARGCTTLGVSTVEEALDILAWTKARIMLLAPPLPGQLPAVVKHNLIPALISPELVPELNRLAALRPGGLTVQIKVDTGFGRLGTAPEDFPALLAEIKQASHLHLGGVFTHFSAAAGDKKFTRGQLQRLLALREAAPAGLLWHAAGSSAFLTLPESHLDLVRLGTLLYGQAPLPLDSSWQLQETWRCQARIIQTRWLPPGHSVGYSRAFRTQRPLRLGVIPVGYGHGLELEPAPSPWRQFKHAAFRALFPKHAVFHGREPLPIVGRVSMGLTCLDLTKSDLQVGDTVSVGMRRTVVSRQIPRLYYFRGKLKCIFWNHQLFDTRGRKISLRGLF